MTDPPHTTEKFDPKKHDPLKDPPPAGPGISQVLEDKLDIIAVQLAKIERGVGALVWLVWALVIPLLALVVSVLVMVGLNLGLGLLGLLFAILALSLLLTALALMLGRRVVRRLDRLYL